MPENIQNKISVHSSHEEYPGFSVCELCTEVFTINYMREMIIIKEQPGKKPGY